jgi:hypothetical protein
LEPRSCSLLIGFNEDHASLFQSHSDHGGTGPLKFMLATLEPADRAATESLFADGACQPVLIGMLL